MGCDIHLHVESRLAGIDREHNWYNTAFYGEFCERCYPMFARLADVRNYDDVKHLPIRGLPEDVSCTVLEEACCEVIPEGEDKHPFHKTNCVDKETADMWVEKGYSKWMNEDHSLCLDPDWHSFNWCTLAELKKCFNEVFDDSPGCEEWLGLIKYMESLEKFGENVTRAVYWFDN